MSSERQIKIVEDHVEDFRAAGAKIETGGRRNPDLEGLFYEPTVITNANNDMRAMQEETFGPTLPIATFTTEEEAIRLANDSEFGLTASVWTRDRAKGKRVAEADRGRLGLRQRGSLHARHRPDAVGRLQKQRPRPHARPRRPDGTRPAAAHPHQPPRAPARRLVDAVFAKRGRDISRLCEIFCDGFGDSDGEAFFYWF